MGTLLIHSLQHLYKLLRVYLDFAFIGVLLALVYITVFGFFPRLGQFSTSDLVIASLALASTTSLLLLVIRAFLHELEALMMTARALNSNVDGSHDGATKSSDRVEAPSTK